MTVIQELLSLVEISEREMLVRRVYDELIVAILRILSRLDLTVSAADSTDHSQVITHTHAHTQRDKLRLRLMS